MSEKIAAAARRWDAARIEAKRLRRERAAFICAAEKTANEAGEPGVPCWKVFDKDEFGRSYRNDDLCESCSDRAAIHAQLAVATRKRGDAERSMILLLAAERKRLAKQSQEAPSGAGG